MTGIEALDAELQRLHYLLMEGDYVTTVIGKKVVFEEIVRVHTELMIMISNTETNRCQTISS